MAISDIDYERIIDKRVRARLATDSAYRNAACPLEAASREIEIERQECEILDYKISKGEG